MRAEHGMQPQLEKGKGKETVREPAAVRKIIVQRLESDFHKSEQLRKANDKVYMSARKSMTIRFYIHSIAKRTEAVALVDSGAIENFLNLTYARWLCLPIKRLPEARKLYNVDGTENKSGELQFYTDLDVRTGTTTTTLRFFLSDLGDHKAILGYPWFAAVQPRIDWKKGWIDHLQLPIVLKAPNAKKAVFTPRTCNAPRVTNQDKYYIAKVTIHPTRPKPGSIEGVPDEYARHRKVFSEEKSQRLPWHTIWDHAIELLPDAPATLPGQLLPLTQKEKEEMQKFVAEHLGQGTIPRIMEPLRSKLLLCEEKGWQVAASPRL
jgi:hypothetical protein